jgi:hypothetical protein
MKSGLLLLDPPIPTFFAEGLFVLSAMLLCKFAFEKIDENINIALIYTFLKGWSVILILLFNKTLSCKMTSL